MSPNTTVAKFATVVKRGFRGEVEEEITYYNLDMIIMGANCPYGEKQE